MKAARARARREAVGFELPLLEDLYSVQVALMQLAEAIALGEIDHQRGRLLLAVLRQASANLKSTHGWSQERNFLVDEDTNLAIIENPGFEKKYGLPEDFDLSRAPEEAFPPAQLTEEAPEESGTESKPFIGTRESDESGSPEDRQVENLQPPRPHQPSVSIPETSGDSASPGLTERKPPRPEGATPTRDAALEWHVSA